MSFVQLPDKLILLPEVVPCSTCHGDARWQHKAAAVCSRCYLEVSTDIRTTKAFSDFAGAVYKTPTLDDEQLNHLLAVLVLTNRMFPEATTDGPDTDSHTTPRATG